MNKPHLVNFEENKLS